MSKMKWTCIEHLLHDPFDLNMNYSLIIQIPKISHKTQREGVYLNSLSFSWDKIPHENNQKEFNEQKTYFSIFQKQKNNWSFIDFITIIIISVLSFYTRFHNIKFPNVVSFDETYFGNFTNYYYEHIYFLDIHTPLGKLILYAGAKYNGYQGKCLFPTPGSVYADGCGHEHIRKSNAFWASFCPIYCYISLKLFNLSYFSCLCGSLMVLFENSMIIEGRFALTDGILHSFVLLSLIFNALLYRKTPLTNEWYISFIIASISVSIACSIKQTSWSLIPYTLLICLLKLFYYYRDQEKEIISFSFFKILILHAMFLIITFSIVYVIVFVIHISIIPELGPGSHFVCPKIIPFYKNKTDVWKECLKMNKIKHVFTLMWKMNDHNMGIFNDEEGIHSRWHKWPLMDQKLITFYYHGDSRIVFHLNLVNSILILFSIIFLSILFYFSYLSEKYSSKQLIMDSFVPLISYFGYFASFIPFHFVPRPTYHYHYIIPMIFGMFCISSILNLVSKYYYKLHILLSLVFSSLSLAFFITYKPWIYGEPILYHDTLILSKKWVT